LFQGVFKAVSVENDMYLLQLNRYIHRNPIGIQQLKAPLSEYIWSSYRIYLDLQKTTYVNTEFILNFFSETIKQLSFQSFTETEDTDDSMLLDHIIEDDESR
jgi:hypothetical protein